MSELLPGATADEVLTINNTGSSPMKCQIANEGDTAPRRQAPNPPGVRDDLEYTPPKSPTTVMRLTCSKTFADDDAHGRAPQKPACLPSIAFNAELTQHSVRTKGATNYESEITMLLIIKTAATPSFLNADLPKGILCNYQQSKIMPRRFKQRPDEAQDAFWKRVAADATAAVQGRLLHRPSDDAPLGVQVSNKLDPTCPPRRAVQRAPAEWTAPEDLTTWALQRSLRSYEDGSSHMVLSWGRGGGSESE